MIRGLLAAAILLFASASARAEIVERVVAVVGEEVILLSELDHTIETMRPQLEAQIAASVPDPRERERVLDAQIAAQRPQILEELIRERLILSQAKSLGVRVSDEEIDAQIEAFAKQQKMKVEQLQEEAEGQGYTWSSYRDEWRRRMLRNRVEQRALAGRVAVSETDEMAYYEMHYAKAGPEQARLRIIFLKAPEDAKEKAKTKKKIQDIHARLKKGESFEKLAKEHSEGPNAQGGGDVGFLARGELAPEIEKAAFSQKIGASSGVIETAQGFFLVQTVERTGGDTPLFEKVRDEIREILWREHAEEAFRSWIEELEKKVNVERKL
ncbi:MAG: peptidylprolyl isomerase [Bdellovibrionota bacterium]